MSMAKVVQLLVLLFLPLGAVICSFTFGDFNRCHQRPVDKKSQEIYREGEKIQLCCNIYPSKLCNGSVSIYHKPFESQNRTLVMESENCTNKLQIPEAKTWNEGMYTCLFKDDIVGNKEVYVVGKPRLNMTILKKKIIPTRDKMIFVITFDPGDMTIFDNITVYRDREIWCTNSSLICPTNKTTCTCKYDIKHDPSYESMTLVIIKTRLFKLNRIETKDTFNPFFYIRPKQVVKLKALNITSSSAKVRWCWSQRMDSIVPFMGLQNASYGYTFQMSKLQGIWQKRVTTISSPYEKGRTLKNRCTVVELQHLTPFTTYEIKINAKTSQSKSQAAKMEFTTKGGIPRTPPKEILFWAVDDNLIQKTVTLFLIWKPLPHDDWGGPIFYDMEIIVDDTELRRQNELNTPYTIVQNIPLDKDLVIKIWAVNNISRSLNFIELRLPRYGIVRDSAGLDLHVDLQKGSAVTYVKLPSGWEASGVHWCPGHQNQQMDKLVMCDEFPLVDESVNKTSEQSPGLLKYTVNLRQNTTVASDSVKEENMVVKHYRNAKLSRHSSTAEVKVTVTQSNSNISPIAYEWNGKPLKFFLSFIRYGKQLSQLFPFSCYYNSSKDTVKLLPRTFSADAQTFLVLEQECDFVNPSQYLVEMYKVLFASSNQCKSVKDSTVVTLKNNVFDQIKMESPHVPTFACITSEGSRHQKSHDIHYVQEPPVGSDLTATAVSYVIGGAILCFIIILGCIYYRKRYKNLKSRFNITDISLTRFVDSNCQVENLIFTKAAQVSDVSECFEKDSGFTASSEVPRTDSDDSHPYSELHKSDVVDNAIIGPTKSIQNGLVDKICPQDVNMETSLSQEPGEDMSKSNESQDGDHFEALGSSTDQEIFSENHLLLMEKLQNQLRQKCPK